MACGPRRPPPGPGFVLGTVPSLKSIAPKGPVHEGGLRGEASSRDFNPPASHAVPAQRFPTRTSISPAIRRVPGDYRRRTFCEPSRRLVVPGAHRDDDATGFSRYTAKIRPGSPVTHGAE